jgi:hypothetical protein
VQRMGRFLLPIVDRNRPCLSMACGISVVHIPRRSCTTCTTTERDFCISTCSSRRFIGIRRCPRGQVSPPALGRPPAAVCPMVCAHYRHSIHLGDGVLEHSWVGWTGAFCEVHSALLAVPLCLSSASPSQPAVSRTSNRLSRRQPSPWRGDGRVPIAPGDEPILHR